ncbi:MAG: hypothetical protein IIT46_06410 [Lachnospiraceae bacterium]|nr:hypothetical protein [Lachnospiraceae bacterium]
MMTNLIAKYIGVTEDEVRDLCEEYHMDYDEIMPLVASILKVQSLHHKRWIYILCSNLDNSCRL